MVQSCREVRRFLPTEATHFLQSGYETVSRDQYIRDFGLLGQNDDEEEDNDDDEDDDDASPGASPYEGLWSSGSRRSRFEVAGKSLLSC